MLLCFFKFPFSVYKFFIDKANLISVEDRRNKIFVYFTYCLIINGVIQEEALSAYSLGFLAILVGFFHNRIRN